MSDMKVEIIDKMGSDLSVVNAARVSFHKYKDKFEDGDEKLIKFLADHNHWSPFGHASLQFRIKAPIFVARQLVKHQVGLVWNEVSRRYVDTPPEFYIPDAWRERAENKKQGSAETFKTYDIDSFMDSAMFVYNDMLEKNIAPEMARMVLPQNMMTEWIWSGSLMAFARVVNLRDKPDTQLESQIIAKHIRNHMLKEFPVSSKYLLD